MKTFRYILASIFALTAIYLVVSAPPPLEASTAGQNQDIPARQMFETVNAINAAARSIYTGRIVGGGLKAGMKFGEDWAEPGVDKGPLPALFLRLVAAELERRPPMLGLYLGSDKPINASNLFTGDQAIAFAAVRQTRGPEFTPAGNGSGAVAMYPDFASAAPCVSCHNDHPDSPKTDWKLDDVMGATTWTWPSDRLSAQDYLDTTRAMLEATRAAYARFLDKAQGFAQPPRIGTDWPGPDQIALPDADTFMAEVASAVGGQVLQTMALAHVKEQQ